MKDAAIMLIASQTVDGDEVIAANSDKKWGVVGAWSGHGSHAGIVRDRLQNDGR